jgi:predicted small metal-binding protein
MAKILACGDIVPGCAAEVRAETEEEVLSQAAAHAREAHGIEKVDDSLVQKLKASIKTR